MGKKQLKYVISEGHILQKANHTFILQLHFAFQTPRHLFFVVDLCPGGDLALALAKQGVFQESKAKFYIAEVVLAVERLHELDVLYRDLKPENILIGKLKK